MPTSDPAASLSTIGFDADDTLWQNEHYYRLTEQRFAAMMSGHADSGDLSARLLEAEKRNLRRYGFGIKGFTLSMIETAIEVSDGRVSASVIRNILEAGRELLEHPIETLPHVREVLAQLASRYRLVLITKGDLFDQERKLAQSGLGEFFSEIEIVSEKAPATYERVFTRYGDGPSRSAMVGNSLRSDILPAIAAGCWAIHVPHALTWAVEHADPPAPSPRFRQIDNLGELVDLIAEITRAESDQAPT